MVRVAFQELEGRKLSCGRTKTNAVYWPVQGRLRLPGAGCGIVFRYNSASHDRRFRALAPPRISSMATGCTTSGGNERLGYMYTQGSEPGDTSGSRSLAFRVSVPCRGFWRIWQVGYERTFSRQDRDSSPSMHSFHCRSFHVKYQTRGRRSERRCTLNVGHCLLRAMSWSFHVSAVDGENAIAPSVCTVSHDRHVEEEPTILESTANIEHNQSPGQPTQNRRCRPRCDRHRGWWLKATRSPNQAVTSPRQGHTFLFGWPRPRRPRNACTVDFLGI
ncbi:hypothetical protein DFP72DRAFT_110251 [Ephemerocybe angulata]|uniref:Uncharacterized protein n=1 Tax=Ephemerocybe angulata TaxID=980116 RepID=A0A8H6LVL2_9AGAR|nr:hypothetical protein DFP72DRAFT_110251 [Tulosesus angulatus]